ncbi:MAG: hypothetical protein HY645_02215 [Acidobacteria bacterium]|nr:hypothetical protein [Acidobacteriota bacterium]
MKTFDFKPNDTLFVRDARPIAAGNVYGRGANWPLPTVLHGALRTALLRNADCLPLKKDKDKTPRNGRVPGKLGTTAFDWLHLHGPFPVRDAKELFFPAPRDLVKSKSRDFEFLRLIERPKGKGSEFLDNLQGGFLQQIPASFEEPSKEPQPDWISSGLLQQYLTGDAIPAIENVLWRREHRIGVAINPATHGAVPGQLYGTEHLRLADKVSLRFAVAERPAHKTDHMKEAGVTLDSLDGTILQLGGEQRFGRIAGVSEDLVLPRVELATQYLKWMLVIPAIFSHGWYPGWIGTDGRVMLRVIDKDARRALRRQRRDAGWQYDEASDPAQRIRARLVAACIGKPRVMSGWELLREETEVDEKKNKGGGRPTFLAVPAGSVFYFETDSEAETLKLQAALQNRCRSDYLGEKGLGLGVCGTWENQKMDKFGKGE